MYFHRKLTRGPRGTRSSRGDSSKPVLRGHHGPFGLLCRASGVKLSMRQPTALRALEHCRDRHAFVPAMERYGVHASMGPSTSDEDVAPVPRIFCQADE